MVPPQTVQQVASSRFYNGDRYDDRTVVQVDVKEEDLGKLPKVGPDTHVVRVRLKELL